MRRSSLETPRASVARRVRSTRVRDRDALAARYAATPRPQVSDRFDGSPDCAAADLAPLPQQPRSKTPSTLADRRSLCASSGSQAGRSAAQLTAPRHLRPDFRRSQVHTGLIVSVCAGQRVDGPRWSCVGVGTRESVWSPDTAHGSVVVCRCVLAGVAADEPGWFGGALPAARAQRTPSGEREPGLEGDPQFRAGGQGRPRCAGPAVLTRPAAATADPRTEARLISLDSGQPHRALDLIAARRRTSLR